MVFLCFFIFFSPSETCHNDLPAAHHDHCGEKRGFEPGVASSAVWRANNEPPHLSFWSVLAVFLLLLLTVKSIGTVSLKPKTCYHFFLYALQMTVQPARPVSWWAAVTNMPTYTGSIPFPPAPPSYPTK